MFVTTAAFKHPVQFTRDAASWRVVELGLAFPFLLVQVSDGDTHRILLLSNMDDLLALREPTGVSAISAVYLVDPLNWLGSERAQCIHMVGLLFQEAPPDRSAASALVRDAQGHLYGGYPIMKLEGPTGPLKMLQLF
jgi:hypothetical protein